MYILGINAYHGDVSCVLLRDGELVCALEEERFRRVKHWAGFPSESILKCLEYGGVGPEDIDYFAVSRDPYANLWRKVLFTCRTRPNVKLVASRLKNMGSILDIEEVMSNTWGIKKERVHDRIRWVEHHPAHIASAFFLSPFDEAAVCSVDGFGDFVSTSVGLGRGTNFKVLGKVYFPHSLGLLYLAITQYLGFMNYGDEYKVMGLSAYGEPDFSDEIGQLVHLTPGGGFKLDLSYYCHWQGKSNMSWSDGAPILDEVYTPKLEELLGPARKADEPLTPRHEAIAASLQHVYGETVSHVLNALYEKLRLPRLCLAGGCAMNSVFNGKIRKKTPFEDIYIQPAAADNGTALGAAYYVWNQVLKNPRSFVMKHSYWGPEYTQGAVERELSSYQAQLEESGCKSKKLPDDESLCRWTAEKIAEGKVVGWFQGRMEWGARALGNRSILADPRRKDMRDIINVKIKFRERFRPFAPVILEDRIDEYFEGAVPDPFMLQVYQVRPDQRERIPAVTHVDGSGRLQTINSEVNEIFWHLLNAFDEITGVPVLLNTSFNENEPIVQKPSEAMECFIRTHMDILVIGQMVYEKPYSRASVSEAQSVSST